jgi:hypothetical protein
MLPWLVSSAAAGKARQAVSARAVVNGFSDMVFPSFCNRSAFGERRRGVILGAIFNLLHVSLNRPRFEDEDMQIKVLQRPLRV